VGHLVGRADGDGLFQKPYMRVVEFIARVPHPRFKKIVKQTKKFYVHDENSEAALGDKVRITETRPMSKNKRWRLVEVLTH
jgi:small subunit ribosomal protein S17